MERTMTVKRPKYKQTAGNVAWNILQYAALIIGTFVVIIPLYFLLVASVKDTSQIVSTNPLLFPSQWHWENFSSAWNYYMSSSNKYHRQSMGIAFLYTIGLAGISLFITVILGAFVSYVLSRFEFHGKRVVKIVFLLASLIPSITMQSTIYNLMDNLYLVDTPYAVVLLMSGTDIVSIYIFLQFLDNIPKDLDEAALVDGCNYWQIFWKIIMPVLKPAVATVCIIKGIAFYNEYYIPSMYYNKHFLISTYLENMVGQVNTSWGTFSAAAVIAIIPTVIIFLLLQNQIYSGLTSGAVKS